MKWRLVKWTRSEATAKMIYECDRLTHTHTRRAASIRTGLKNIEKWGQNFERLVLGCIDADLYNQILNLQHFPRSTRFANLCTAPNSKFQQKIVHTFCKLKYWNVRNYMKIIQNFQYFETFYGHFDELLSEFRDKFQKMECSMDVYRFFCQILWKFPRNFAQPNIY